ncbi:MAG: YicC family protein, partial [Betaproteobacteria bacterium]|nr:YicC family protein [Betaproteobacteria bacterium]
MPVYSMTGYASVTHERGLVVECRSVNGRFLDLSLKLPEEWRGFEPALRELVAARVKRGKLELRASFGAADHSPAQVPSAQVLRQLAQWQADVQDSLPQSRPLSVAEALQLARSLAPSTTVDVDVLAAAQACIAALSEARAREGQRLADILLERIELIESLALRAQPLVPAVVQRQQARFLERWHEALKAADAQTPGATMAIGPQALQERALSEAAAFALRIDVAEELTRLQAHLQEIRRLLEQGGELGKRLDFLIQELHREANTLGSKATALELTGLAVDMKVAIEQMRE